MRRDSHKVFATHSTPGGGEVFVLIRHCLKGKRAENRCLLRRCPTKRLMGLRLQTCTDIDYHTHAEGQRDTGSSVPIPPAGKLRTRSLTENRPANGKAGNQRGSRNRRPRRFIDNVIFPQNINLMTRTPQTLGVLLQYSVAQHTDI